MALKVIRPIGLLAKLWENDTFVSDRDYVLPISECGGANYHVLCFCLVNVALSLYTHSYLMMLFVGLSFGSLFSFVQMSKKT
jgi:hypothetical protein